MRCLASAILLALVLAGCVTPPPRSAADRQAEAARLELMRQERQIERAVERAVARGLRRADR